MKPKLKMGIVGGGGIGVVHQMAARLDGKIELVAGAFSSDAERSKRSGEQLGLHPSRVSSNYRAMAVEEAQLPAGERIDFVSIVTHRIICTSRWQRPFSRQGSTLSATSR
jgi:predicted dehydrogenase